MGCLRAHQFWNIYSIHEGLHLGVTPARSSWLWQMAWTWTQEREVNQSQISQALKLGKCVGKCLESMNRSIFHMSFADPFNRSSHFFSQFDCRNAFRMQRAVGVGKHNFVAPWKRTLLHPELRKEYRWSGSQRVLPESLRIFVYHAYITYTPKSSILIGFSIHTKFVVITPR